MKAKLFFIVFICGSTFYSCDKPRLGEYRLSMDDTEYYEASLERSTSKHLTYAFGNFEGTLDKSINKVTGVLTVNLNSKPTYTISVDGSIQHDAILDYEINGIYTTGTKAGLFKISKVRK